MGEDRDQQRDANAMLRAVFEASVVVVMDSVCLE